MIYFPWRNFGGERHSVKKEKRRNRLLLLCVVSFFASVAGIVVLVAHAAGGQDQPVVPMVKEMDGSMVSVPKKESEIPPMYDKTVEDTPAESEFEHYKAGTDVSSDARAGTEEESRMDADTERKAETGAGSEDGVKSGSEVGVISEPEILEMYADAYAQNQDMIGWLTIDDTVINYPVMQTMWNETYYLRLSFDREYNTNGCLIMDTDSVVGSGTAEYAYRNGTSPSTNLIIHGHRMKSGLMFGQLNRYEDPAYGEAHRIIRFDSLYERREYELIAVFYSQVFYQNQDVFKYYKFFQAETEEEFDDWYTNIKRMSLYETGVKAEFGDEFITLSCCSYHVEDGRFVVIGKRIK